MNKEDYIEAVISGYRKQLEMRYQYDTLSVNYNLPDSFDETRVDIFRNYFLEYIYPDMAKRNELNLAFQSLDNYIKHPEKLIRLVLDSASLLFKYGRHLRKILTAGIKALKCFRTATKFEQSLADQAATNDLKAPFDKEDFDIMFGGLDAQEVEAFIKNTEALYETLYDRSLVKKIKSVVVELIKKMEKRPKIYSIEEINGLKIGRDIINEGDKLFDELRPDDQRAILELAIQIERDAIGVVFS